jgi:hypothetical protein
MRRQERHLERHDQRMRDDGRMAISICLYGLSLMAVMAYVWVNPPSKHHDSANGPELIRLASDARYAN